MPSIFVILRWFAWSKILTAALPKLRASCNVALCHWAPSDTVPQCRFVWMLFNAHSIFPKVCWVYVVDTRQTHIPTHPKLLPVDIIQAEYRTIWNQESESAKLNTENCTDCKLLFFMFNLSSPQVHPPQLQALHTQCTKLTMLDSKSHPLICLHVSVLRPIKPHKWNLIQEVLCECCWEGKLF